MKKCKKQPPLPGMSGWGGQRAGAGRHKAEGMISHSARPCIKRTTAVHVNLHLAHSIKELNLRTKDFFKLFRHAIVTARKRGLKIVHYAIMHNHLHLIVEAQHNVELSKGMQSLALSLNKLIKNRTRFRIRRLWQDRYFMRTLRSPREIKIALQYVLKNSEKQFHKHQIIDLYASIFNLLPKIKMLFPHYACSVPPDIIRRFQENVAGLLHIPEGYLLKTVLH